MRNTTIVGFGSPFGDDRFGWRVIEQLQTAPRKQTGIKAICCDRSVMDWIHQYLPVDRLIFVDAVVSDATPGTLHHLTLTPSEFENLPASFSSHGVGLREGVALARAVIDLPEAIEFYGVELERCSAEDAESSRTLEQAKVVSRQILESSLHQKDYPVDRNESPI